MSTVETADDRAGATAKTLATPGMVILVDGGKPTLTHVFLNNKTLRLGRSKACEVVLADSLASGAHVEVGYNPKLGFLVRDLNSRNGTSADGELFQNNAVPGSPRILRVGGAIVLLVHGLADEIQRLYARWLCAASTPHRSR